MHEGAEARRSAPAAPRAGKWRAAFQSYRLRRWPASEGRLHSPATRRRVRERTVTLMVGGRSQYCCECEWVVSVLPSAAAARTVCQPA